MFFDFQTKTPVSKILKACLASNSLIWVQKRKKKPEYTVYLSNATSFLWYLTVMLTPLLCIQTISVISGILRRKSTAYWSCCNAKLFFLKVFQSEATKHNYNDYLIRHIEETIVMRTLMQFRTNVNYMAYISDGDL